MASRATAAKGMARAAERIHALCTAGLPAQELIQRVAAVKMDDIVALATDVLDVDSYSLVSLGPSGAGLN